MDRSAIGTITAGLQVAGLDTPKIVTDAEKIHAEAVEVQAAIQAETEPTVTLELGKIKRSIDAQVAYRAGRTDRVALAERAVVDASARVGGTWQTALPDLHEAFRAAFNAAAVKFGDALAALGGNTDPSNATASDASAAAYRAMQAAVSDLAMLTAVRDAYADYYGQKGDTISIDEERLTRVMVLPDRTVGVRRINHRAGHFSRTADGFKELLDAGCVIKWQDASEQTANSVAIHSARAA